ncbi:hypothetical protein ISCGN_010992 [Ixodes scapularis]
MQKALRQIAIFLRCVLETSSGYVMTVLGVAKPGLSVVGLLVRTECASGTGNIAEETEDTSGKPLNRSNQTELPSKISAATNSTRESQQPLTKHSTQAYSLLVSENRPYGYSCSQKAGHNLSPKTQWQVFRSMFSSATELSADNNNLTLQIPHPAKESRPTRTSLPRTSHRLLQNEEGSNWPQQVTATAPTPTTEAAPRTRLQKRQTRHRQRQSATELSADNNNLTLQIPHPAEESTPTRTSLPRTSHRLLQNEEGSNWSQQVTATAPTPTTEAAPRTRLQKRQTRHRQRQSATELLADNNNLTLQVLTMLLICTEHGPSEEDHVIGAAHGTITTSHIYDTITATGQQHLPVLQPSPSYGSSSSTALQALPIKKHSTRGYDSGLGTCLQERMAKPPVLLYQARCEPVVVELVYPGGSVSGVVEVERLRRLQSCHVDVTPAAAVVARSTLRLRHSVGAGRIPPHLYMSWDCHVNHVISTTICEFGETTVAYGSVVVTEGNVEGPDIHKDLSVLLICLAVFREVPECVWGLLGEFCSTPRAPKPAAYSPA